MTTSSDPETPAPEAGVIPPILRVEGLTKLYPVYAKGLVRRVTGKVRAVDNVSFDLLPGETLGLVGESGCGKTTTSRCILRAITPSSGRILFQSRGLGEVDLATLPEKELKPLRKEIQMIFQDPYSSLNQRMTVGDIVAEPLVIHGVGNERQRKDQVAEMLERVGMQSIHMQRYPNAFSGGQRQRIGIARALVLRPSLVVADEAVSALDVSVQAQVINLLQDLQEELNLTYLFVAHDLSVVRHISDRVAIMQTGRLVEMGETEAVFREPREEYTKKLLRAIPSPDPEERLALLNEHF